MKNRSNDLLNMIENPKSVTRVRERENEDEESQTKLPGVELFPRHGLRLCCFRPRFVQGTRLCWLAWRYVSGLIDWLIDGFIEGFIDGFFVGWIRRIRCRRRAFERYPFWRSWIVDKIDTTAWRVGRHVGNNRHCLGSIIWAATAMSGQFLFILFRDARWRHDEHRYSI